MESSKLEVLFDNIFVWQIISHETCMGAKPQGGAGAHLRRNRKLDPSIQRIIVKVWVCIEYCFFIWIYDFSIFQKLFRGHIVLVSSMIRL